MKLRTCLCFDGQAREAANFYTSIFPDSSIADNWIAPTDTPGNKQGEEVVVNFTIFGQAFIGLNGGPQFPHSEAISFQIPCADQAEIDKYWSLLIADGWHSPNSVDKYYCQNLNGRNANAKSQIHS